jgi:hypothetical protein
MENSMTKSSTITVKDAAIFLNPVLREAVVLFI